MQIIFTQSLQQRRYIKVAINFSDEVLGNPKTSSFYTVNLKKNNLEEKLKHVIHLNICTSNQFEKIIINVRNSIYFFLLLRSQTGII